MRPPRVRRDSFRRASPDLPTRVPDGYGASLSIARLPTCAGLVSGFCSSSPTFASGFLPTPPRDDAVAFSYQFPPSGPGEDLHLLDSRHAWHTSSRREPRGSLLSHHRAYLLGTTAVSLNFQHIISSGQTDESLLYKPLVVHGLVRCPGSGNPPPPFS